MYDNVVLSTFLKNREKLFISLGTNTVSLFQELKVCVQILTDSLVETEEKRGGAQKQETGGRGMGEKKEVIVGAHDKDDKNDFPVLFNNPQGVHT